MMEQPHTRNILFSQSLPPPFYSYKASPRGSSGKEEEADLVGFPSAASTPAYPASLHKPNDDLQRGANIMIGWDRGQIMGWGIGMVLCCLRMHGSMWLRCCTVPTKYSGAQYSGGPLLLLLLLNNHEVYIPHSACCTLHRAYHASHVVLYIALLLVC